jgi:protein gp37
MKANSDRLETYSIVWLDASVNNEENMSAQKQLRSVLNQVRTFINPEEFMKYVRLMQQGDLTILIVSGQLGRIVVPEMQKLEQVCSIYIYCFNKEANLEWTRSFSKVSACSSSNALHILLIFVGEIRL